MIEPPPYVLAFDARVAEHAALVGGKCANLGILLGAGISVPPGFAVTTHAYRVHIERAGLAHLIGDTVGRLEPSDLAAAERASAHLRGLIRKAPPPPEVAAQVRASYAALCARRGEEDLPVAVRSSAVGEDSDGASFAGQQETYLGVRGADAVIQRVVDCWGSLFSPPALTYRARLGLDPTQVGMGVAVQAMVDARSSGVMFTLNPVNGDRSKIVIESSFGLGLAIVGGEVNPDRFFVDKVVLRLVERTIAAKPVAYRLSREDHRVRLVEVPPAAQALPSLSDEEVIALAALGKRIEAHYGRPQDIEWAIAEGRDAPPGRLYILQARPETVWSKMPATPIAPPYRNPLEQIVQALRTPRRLRAPGE